MVLSGASLEQRRKESPDSKYAEALRRLKKRADGLVVSAKTYSVTNKTMTPPSGDKHDYMSQAPYWWPDAARPGGLPYVRRDGERNPELSKISDSEEMDRMIKDAECLAVEYYLTGDEKYAGHFAALVRAWFLDPKTRQNPNLNFAQGIPGINTGRGIGLIETRNLYRVIDSAILVEGNRAWTRADQDQLRKWFGDFLKWMLESPVGKDEADERNNHGTYYDVQVVAYAIFTGQKDIAVKQLEKTKERIKSQIETDGRQPLELARTLSWNYANMNLFGFFTLARLGESVNVDLWNYKSADDRSIRQAFEWLLPYAKDSKEWKNQQIKPRSFELTTRLLRVASIKYKNPEYVSVAERLEAGKQDDIAALNLN